MAKERLYNFDRVRAIAIAMVVGVHCLPSPGAVFAGDVSSHAYVQFCKTLFFTCNALFFMLSGKFNLRALRDSEYKRYYYRRIRGVFVPVLIYLMIYTVFNLYPDFISLPHVLKVFLLNSLGELGHGIFWFVFTLFGMLMVAPFLAKAFNKPSKAFQKAFFIVWLIWNTLNYLGANVPFDFAWAYPFAAWFFFFCIGGFVESSFLNEMKTRSLLLLGIGAWVANALLACAGWTKCAYDQSPLYGITAICLFLILLRIQPSGNRIVQKCVSFIAGKSLGIYLMHWLAFLMLKPYFVALEQVSGILYHFCLGSIVFIAGLLLAVVVETILVAPMQKFIDLVGKRIDEASFGQAG